ncbi:MAG: methyltransferase domain-containing protein, partial [Cyclobacteriaceae bacterium]
MQRFQYLLLAYFIVNVCVAQDPWKNIYTENAWADRDKWQRADDIIEKLALGEGSSVADIGCHEGYMTLKLARTVGRSGKVFAVDVQQSRLDKLDTNLKELRLSNVTTIKGDYDNPHLS